MKIKSIEKLTESFDRFDLEIKNNNNFFANGVLVHNCSFTAALINDEFIVCSRNVNLKEDDTNLYWKIAREYDIEKKMRDAGLNDYAIQGEIWGNGIQGNIYKVQQQYLSIFTVQHKGQYLPPAERQELCKKLSLPHSPVLHNDWKIDGKSIDEILLMADGQSVCGTIGCLREGLVFKSKDGKHIWKVVSNRYLEKQK